MITQIQKAFSREIPSRNELLHSQLSWIDLSQAPRLFALDENFFCLKWLNKDILSPSEMRHLCQGHDEQGRRYVSKGLKNGARLLEKNLNGKKSRIILSIDYDFLRDSAFSNEMESYLKLLKHQPWVYIIFSETPYLSNFAEIIRDYDSSFTKDRIQIFFTGFNQPMDRILSHYFSLEQNSFDNSCLSEETLEKNRKNPGFFFELARTASLLSIFETIKINFLLDIPFDDIQGGFLKRQAFSSLISRCFLKENISQKIDIFFQDPFAKNKFSQLASWLEKRGHNLKTLDF